MVRISKSEGDINFVQAFFGLIFRPFATIDKLFFYPKPVYSAGILLFLCLTVLVPIFASELIHGRMMYKPIQVTSLLLVLVMTFIYFVFLESLFLMLLKVPSTVSGLAHSICYCMPAITAMLWILYIANYLTTGTLSFVTFALTGYATADDPFIRAVPVLLNIAFFIMFLVFTRALKLMGDMFTTNSVIIGLLSIFPFHAALILSVLSANFINPGTTDTFVQLIYAPASLIVGGN